MAAHPRSAAKKSTGFYEEVKENFGDDRRTKRSAKKKGEAALRQSDDLFEIEIVKRDPMQKKIKVHFIGYGSEDDEWQDCSGDNRPVMKFVLLPTPSQSSLDERYSTFCDSLARKIKFSLSITKRVNPDTLISIEVDSDIMPLILSNVKHSEITRGRTTCYSVSNNHDLDVLFREGWDYRIENLQGDFSYVTQGSVSFYLKKVKHFLEYKILGNTPVQCWSSRRSLFNFNFVRKEGTKCQFEAGNWMA